VLDGFTDQFCNLFLGEREVLAKSILGATLLDGCEMTIVHSF
jgi:hypothetical protein